MTVTLYLAPAGSGKSSFAIEQVRRATRGLQACPRVCVANHQQLVAWERRLSQPPGCIGAHILTFDDLHVACLAATGVRYTRIGDVVQYRLLRAVAAELPLEHYKAVRGFPGFVQECRRVINEMKSAQIAPERFLRAVRDLGDPPRLRELGLIYERYQQHLQENDLVDNRGLGWLALEALAIQETPTLREWDLLVLDGFASFTQTQLSLLAQLQDRIPHIVITLTGEHNSDSPRTAHRHFMRVRRLLEEKLDLSVKTSDFSEKSDVSTSVATSPLRHLEKNLFRPSPDPAPTTEEICLATVPDHAAEVRLALRWLKERIVVDGIPPQRTALAARDLTPYRPYILQISEEFGLPVYLVDGPSLQKNPCIAALLSLLRLLLPDEGSSPAGAPALQRRAFLAALRSPYFDWQALTTSDSTSGIAPLDAADVERLDLVARWGNVIAGYGQWTETLQRLAQMTQPDFADEGIDDETGAPPATLPRGTDAADLHIKLQFCLQRMLPPQGSHSVSYFVRWLEDFIGPPPQEKEQDPASPSLNMLSCLLKSDPILKSRDLVALRTFKEVLRGLVWAEQAGLFRESLDYTQFYDEVAGAVEAASYLPGSHDERGAILVSNVIQGRGVPCRALAVMGLSEGLFPATLAEDPFLTEVDRTTLRAEHDLPLEPAIQSFEQEYFYETVARPWGRLLLTRPSQAESGATWEPSPFWTEIQRLTGVGDSAEDESVHNIWTGAPPPACHAELLMQFAIHGAGPHEKNQRDHVNQRAIPPLPNWTQIESAANVFRVRYGAMQSEFDGWLHEDNTRLSRRFGPQYTWSASRLENYLSCPFHYFLAHVLGIEAPEEPAEGLDARQLGNIYHRLFEQTYQRLPLADRSDLERLRESLHEVAPHVLGSAPQREGFRETAWWRQTQQEILANVEKSLEELAQLDDRFVPTYLERIFGRSNPLHLQRSGDRLTLRGIVDRVDVDAQGNVRLIDYKTAGPYGYNRPAHRDGKRLQLPLYALAVEEALQLGAVVDGFYWHVRHAEASRFTLREDARAAMETAVEHAWSAVDGARQGQFAPEPPDGGCPSYCPGAAFCWRYRPPRSY
ncbi:MAG: PD-(D/E)XK nuclease family protein [Chloroflexota bacterium]